MDPRRCAVCSGDLVLQVAAAVPGNARPSVKTYCVQGASVPDQARVRHSVCTSTCAVPLRFLRLHKEKPCRWVRAMRVARTYRQAISRVFAFGRDGG